MDFINFSIVILLLFNVINYSNQENIELNPNSNYEPCSLINQTLTCVDKLTVSSKFSIISDNIRIIKFINSNSLSIPSNFIKCSRNLKTLIVESEEEILTISNEAFHGCLELTSLVLTAHKESPDKFIYLQPVLTKLISLNEFMINYLPLQNLTNGYLEKQSNLKKLSIRSRYLKSISPFILPSSYRLHKLSLSDITDIKSILSIFKQWPVTGFKVYDLTISNFNVNSFPIFHPNIGQYIKILNFSRTLIQEITTESARSVKNIEELYLPNAHLDSYRLNGLSEFKKLKILDLNSIGTLMDLPIQIEKLNNLEKISFSVFQGNFISIVLPSSIKTIIAPYLKKDIQINSEFLSKANSLSYLNTLDISFLISKIKVFSKSLNFLSLSSTNIVSLHSWEFIKLLSSLKGIYLNQCDIKSIPANIFIGMPNLTELHLPNNKLTYNSFNEPDWQNVMRNLTKLDLSYNYFFNLPSCAFYDFHGNLNIKGNPLSVCLITWINNSNFSVDFKNKAATTNCNEIEKDNCKPIKNIVYKIDFSIKFVKTNNSLMIYKFIKRHILNYMFDHMTLELQLGNGSLLHLDGGSELQMNQKYFEIDLKDIKIPDGSIYICLVFWRKLILYKYDQNCKIVNISQLIIDYKKDDKGGGINLGGWPGVLGIICGTILVTFLALIMIICCCRGRIRRKHDIDDDVYDVDIYDNNLRSVDNSTEYSEPKDFTSVENLRESHYTYVSEDRMMAPTDEPPPVMSGSKFAYSTLPARRENSYWSLYGNSMGTTSGMPQRSRSSKRRESSQQSDSLFRSMGELLDSTADIVSTAIMPRNFEKRISKKSSIGGQSGGGTVGKIKKKNKLEVLIQKRQQNHSTTNLSSTRAPLHTLSMIPSPSEANLTLNQDEKEFSPRQRLSLPPVPRSKFKSEPVLTTQMSHSSSSRPVDAPPKPSISQLRYKELLASVDQHLAQLSMANPAQNNETAPATSTIRYDKN